MRKINAMLELTKRGTPWALARFNDGEMTAVMSAKGAVARGDQPCSRKLQEDLRMCICQYAPNLYMGVPCSVCYPIHWGRAKGKLSHYVEHEGLLTHAVVQTNRNLHRFKTEMPIALIGRRVVWVSGGDQDVSKLPFPVAQHIKVATKDAYTHNWIDLIRHTFDADDVVFLSCGPLATLMAVRQFLDQPYATFIDIGSTWDPETRGVSHSCHTGTLKACRECN